MSFMFLNDEKIYLRPPEKKDINQGYLAGINNQQFDQYTDHALFPKTAEDLNLYIENRKNDLWLGMFIQENKLYIGNLEISINWVHRKGTFSIILWREQGKGYGYAASKLVLEHVFNKLNLHRVELGVNSLNKGAIALYNKLGFRQEGIQKQAMLKNNQYSDIILMGLLAEDFRTIENAAKLSEKPQ